MFFVTHLGSLMNVLTACWRELHLQLRNEFTNDCLLYRETPDLNIQSFLFKMQPEDFPVLIQWPFFTWSQGFTRPKDSPSYLFLFTKL